MEIVSRAYIDENGQVFVKLFDYHKITIINENSVNISSDIFGDFEYLLETDFFIDEIKRLNKFLEKFRNKL